MITQLLSDTELIVNYTNGDSSAFNILFDRYKNKLHAYISSMMQDRQHAEDVFQDTLFKVIYHINAGSYQENGRFVHWMMRIAHNQIIDYYRRKSKFNCLSGKHYQDFFNNISTHETTEKKMIKDQIDSDVRKLLKQLPYEQRRVVVMRHYGDMDFKFIAEKTGVSINTAVGRMRYALINLRKLAETQNSSLF